MSLTIRPARAEDRPVLEAFMGALQELEREMEPNRLPGPEMAALHLAWLEAQAEAHEGAVLLAEADGAPVGFLICFADEDPGFFVRREEARFGYIADLYVEEAARGSGAGQALMEAAEAHFRGLGIRQLRLFAVAGNARARAFYAKLGYGLYEVSLRKEM
ncbi:N-acetyltransferase family protein [Tepidicaulis sp. LMO-SS28]|uniref:GNAT family N-acetyltransferase n=1 Tax=Tepidicaulis sp. LMO-SS28 TaxID=3447455 RepID=UPI003EE3D8D1